MRLSMAATFKQIQSLVNFPTRLDIIQPFFRRKEKVVILMGATGTGKSKLAIDLATRFPSEIINSDKMQVYQGLDIVTNKVTEEESRGIPHHLLGFIDPNSNFTSIDFHHHALNAVESIVSRDRLPIIAGGSNSYIDALVNDSPEFQLKFECCFLWVDVSLPILHSFVSDRVDRMVKAGLVEEVKQIFNQKANYNQGIRRAIGVPELDEYLQNQSNGNEETLDRLLETSIAKIKDNTCQLACRQLQNILRLQRRWDWNLHRIDATEVFLKRGEEAEIAWEKLVADPSSMIVSEFLDEQDCFSGLVTPTPATVVAASTPLAATIAAAAAAM